MEKKDYKVKRENLDTRVHLVMLVIMVLRDQRENKETLVIKVNKDCKGQQDLRVKLE